MPKKARTTAVDRRSTIVIASVAVVAALSVTIWLAANRANARVGPPDFNMVAYQGEDELGGSDVTSANWSATAGPSS